MAQAGVTEGQWTRLAHCGELRPPVLLELLAPAVLSLDEAPVNVDQDAVLERAHVLAPGAKLGGEGDLGGLQASGSPSGS